MAVSGNDLTVNWNITPKTAYVSEAEKQLYTLARDNSDSITGWVAKGTWKIIANNTAPTAGTLTPIPMTTEAERPQTFAAVYSDADGYANLKTADLRVGPSTGLSAIWATYDRNVNKLYLKDDGGKNLPADCAPGASGTLDNTQGTINCQQTTVSVTGNDLTVNWNITPKAAFASTTAKSVAMLAKDNSAASSGWISKGSWKIIDIQYCADVGRSYAHADNLAGGKAPDLYHSL